MSFLVGFSTPKQGEGFSFIPSFPFLLLPSLTFHFLPLKTPKQSLSRILFQGHLCIIWSIGFNVSSVLLICSFMLLIPLFLNLNTLYVFEIIQCSFLTCKMKNFVLNPRQCTELSFTLLQVHPEGKYVVDIIDKKILTFQRLPHLLEWVALANA
jgi:hypothetical protein